MKKALFSETAENPPALEDVVRISNLYPYIQKKRTTNGLEVVPGRPTSLGTKVATSIEVIIEPIFSYYAKVPCYDHATNIVGQIRSQDQVWTCMGLGSC